MRDGGEWWCANVSRLWQWDRCVWCTVSTSSGNHCQLWIFRIFRIFQLLWWASVVGIVFFIDCDDGVPVIPCFMKSNHQSLWGCRFVDVGWFAILFFALLWERQNGLLALFAFLFLFSFSFSFSCQRWTWACSDQWKKRGMWKRRSCQRTKRKKTKGKSKKKKEKKEKMKKMKKKTLSTKNHKIFLFWGVGKGFFSSSLVHLWKSV